jgi:hypothetical protein
MQQCTNTDTAQLRDKERKEGTCSQINNNFHNLNYCINDDYNDDDDGNDNDDDSNNNSGGGGSSSIYI